MSVAHGGSGFPYLYKGVYEYLCGKQPSSVSITASVIPDYAARKVVEKVYSNIVFVYISTEVIGLENIHTSDTLMHI